MNKKHYLLLIGLFVSIICFGQNTPEGSWKTIDDKTGDPASIITIYSQGGEYFGKITELLRKDPSSVCDKCPNEKKGQKIVGMVILEGMKPYKDYWKKGTILDPESGNTYGCSMWFEEGKADELKVRGKHWTGIYRTQSWYRIK